MGDILLYMHRLIEGGSADPALADRVPEPELPEGWVRIKGRKPDPVELDTFSPHRREAKFFEKMSGDEPSPEFDVENDTFEYRETAAEREEKIHKAFEEAMATYEENEDEMPELNDTIGAQKENDWQAMNEVLDDGPAFSEGKIASILKSVGRGLGWFFTNAWKVTKKLALELRDLGTGLFTGIWSIGSDMAPGVRESGESFLGIKRKPPEVKK